MDDFALQRSLARHILKARPGVADGMEHVISTLEKRSKGLDWEKLRDIDWDKGLPRWVAWMDALCTKLPPPPLGLLWFETPSELNPALTSISGWARLGAKKDGYGADAARVWPVKKAGGFTAGAGMHALAELEQGWRSVGWSRRGRGPRANALRPGVFATGYAYVLLLVINGLAKTTLAKSMPRGSTTGVVTGWAEGEIDAVGGYKDESWVAMPRVKTAPVREFVDASGGLLVEYLMDPRRYLKEGGDPRWRHPKTGETFLHAACEGVEDIAIVKAALDAGVDVNAVAKTFTGPATFLDVFGAGPVEIIRLAVERGAKPSDGRGGRDHYFDTIVDDGRCTVEHLHLLDELGVSMPKGRRPLHGLAELSASLVDGGMAQLRKQLEFWVRRGLDIDARDEEGRTPLWVSLHRHAEDVAGLRKNRGDSDEWSNDYARFAIVLLEHGADPNARVKTSPHALIPRGATPLMLRCYTDGKLVRALLKAGADPLATSAEGKTALDYAQAAATKSKAPGHEGVGEVIAALTKAMKHTTVKRNSAKR